MIQTLTLKDCDEPEVRTPSDLHPPELRQTMMKKLKLSVTLPETKAQETKDQDNKITVFSRVKHR